MYVQSYSLTCTGHPTCSNGDLDASAVALCRDNNIPIVVFSIREKGNLARVLSGQGVQTIVTNEKK